MRGQAPKTLAALAALAATLPLNLLATAIALLRRRRSRQASAPASRSHTVLITGGKMTKALVLARAFAQAGHRVVLAESSRYRLTGHRFSRAVARFAVLPESGSPEYADRLRELMLSERVDLWIPVSSPAGSVPDADAARAVAGICKVLHADSETVRLLDDKHALAQMADRLGLRVPDSHRITDAQQVIDFDFSRSARPYVLKSIAYDPVRRLDLTHLPLPTPAETAEYVRSLPISPQRPWILQEFIEGREYCTHSTVVDGRVTVHVCCESSPFQVNYAPVERPGIDAWVRRLVSELDVTGQVSFDFIEAADGTPFAIECNPRTHSAITLLGDDPQLAAAYLGQREGELRPLPDARPTHWTYHELWRMLSAPRAAGRRLLLMLRGRDAIFDPFDPLPFLAVHHVQIPALLLGNLMRRGRWVRIDFNIGKLVEPAGD